MAQPSSATRPDGQLLSLDSIEMTDKLQTVYNMRIADYHTYFVGCDEWGFSVWAHNADGCGVRSLGKEELTRKLAKGEVVTDPAEIQALLGSSGLKAKGAHNPDAVVGGLFQYYKKNGGAGFIGVTRDPETHVLTLVSNAKTKGANATVAKIGSKKGSGLGQVSFSVKAVREVRDLTPFPPSAA